MDLESQNPVSGSGEKPADQPAPADAMQPTSAHQRLAGLRELVDAVLSASGNQPSPEIGIGPSGHLETDDDRPVVREMIELLRDWFGNPVAWGAMLFSPRLIAVQNRTRDEDALTAQCAAVRRLAAVSAEADSDSRTIRALRAAWYTLRGMVWYGSDPDQGGIVGYAVMREPTLMEEIKAALLAGLHRLRDRDIVPELGIDRDFHDAVDGPTQGVIDRLEQAAEAARREVEALRSIR